MNRTGTLRRASRMASTVHARAVAVRSGVGRRFWALLRDGLAKRGDPAIVYRIGGSELLLPLSHRLPDYRLRYPWYDTALPRLAAFLAVRRVSPLVVLDIGANVGDTALPLLVQTDCRMIAVEGNPAFLPYLRHNLERFGDRVVIVPAFAGTGTSGPVALETAHGTARLVPASDADADSTPFLGLAEIVGQAGLGDPGLLKTDTDGFDIGIIEAGLAWLAKHRPVLFFEFDPALTAPSGADSWGVFAKLATAGYRSALVWLNTGELCRSFALDDGLAVAELRALLTCSAIAYFDIAAFADSAEAAQFRDLELAVFSQ